MKPAAATVSTHELDPGQCATAATAEDHNGVDTEQVDHVEGGRKECEWCKAKENYEINIEQDVYDCEQEEEYEKRDNDDLQDQDW